MRFLVHLCFVGVIAPVVGATTYVVLCFLADGRIQELMELRRLLGFVAFGAFYFLGFVAFVTFPFALLSMPLCYRMAKSRALTIRSWVWICALLGMLLGVLMSLWSLGASVLGCVAIGAILGAVSGLVLQKAWLYDWEHAA